MKKEIFIVIAVFLFLFACNNASNKGVIVAEINGNYLYEEDLVGLDSVQHQQAITFWLKEQIWVEYARKNNLDTDIENKVEDYRNKLLIQAAKKNAAQKYTKSISEEDILAYYKENEENFKIIEPIFEIEYYILPQDLQISLIEEELNSFKEGALLGNYCSEHPENCFQEPTWVSASYLSSIPIPEYLWSQSGKIQKYYRDDEHVCLFRIIAKKKEGELMPLSFVNEQIIQILQVQRENDIIKQKEEEFFQNANNNNEIKIY